MYAIMKGKPGRMTKKLKIHQHQQTSKSNWKEYRKLAITTCGLLFLVHSSDDKHIHVNVSLKHGKIAL